MNKCTERLYNGLVKENPTFVLMLGMCPTLAVTTSAINGVGMGLSTTVVLIMSNMLISMLRKIIPDSVRMPAFIVIVASFVTIVQFLMEGFVPSLYDSLGLYIPLIVVNCIILGRAESYASKNPVLPSIFDGIGMGLGFTVGLTAIGIVRELIGAGKIFDIRVMPESYEPLTIFILAPGAFFVLAGLVALQNKVKNNMAKKGKKVPETVGCGEGCASCGNASSCSGKIFPTGEEDAKNEYRRGQKVKELLLIAVGSAFVNNVVLSQFLGICPFLGVSKNVKTAAGMGGAVVFVITIASFVTGLIYKFILGNPNIMGGELSYLNTIVFILVIAALVQFVEMFLKKTMPSLYNALGVYLPLITTNCAVLGVALTNVQNGYYDNMSAGMGLLTGVVNGFATAVGFLVSIVLMAGIREKIEYNDISESFQGTPIVLVTAGLMAIAFFGFSGLI